MITIDLTPLTPGLHEIDLEPSAEEADLDAEVFGQVRVVAQIEYRPERVLAQVEARASAVLTCDRTLKPYTEEVGGRHTVLFLADPHAGGAAASDSEDVRALPLPGVPIDITDIVRDTLLLALPTRRVAPGADTTDIPLVFGEESDRRDPRWDVLERLRENP